MKKFYYFIFLIIIQLISTKSFAQDNCSSAITITPSSGGCTSNGPYSNVGATSVGDPVPSCWGSAPSKTMWFKFVATATQVTVNTNFTTSPGSITDDHIAMFSGSCGSFTEVACSENIGPGNNMAAFSEYGLTVGTTYYIMVDGNAGQTGNFNICIENIANPVPPAPGQDCGNAFPLCDKTSKTYDPFPAGFGAQDDKGTCLTFGETRSILVTFTISVAGTLTFTIDPKSNGAEYDWVLFNSTSGCALKSQAACNYNYDGEKGGNTGMGTGTPAAEFSSSISVTVGQVYTLVISNYSNNATGFDLSFGGTCEFQGPKAAFTANPTSGCSPLNVNFTNTSIGASTYSWDFGDGYPVTSATSPSHTYTAGGTYTVELTAKGAGACIVTYQLPITVTTPVANFISTVACVGSPTTFTNTSTNSISYQWDFTGDGTIDNTSTSPSYTFPASGTYNTRLIGTNATGCKDTTDLTVSVVSPIISILPAPPIVLCNGDSIQLTGTIGLNPTTYLKNFNSTNGAPLAIPDYVKAGGGVPGVLNNSITVSGVSFSTITASTIASVCFTIDHTRQADITVVTLKCGAGAAISFSPLPLSGNGVSTYCFSAATLAGFIGQNPNQTWTLHIEDNGGQSKGNDNVGTLVNWSISLNTANTITAVSWSPTSTLKGITTDATKTSTTASAKPSVTTTYTVTATDATGCSGTKSVVVTVCVAVPIELISFKAIKNEKKVIVNWATAIEKNSDYFEIEKSFDGINFLPIGKIAATVNSNIVKNYNFIDDRPSEGLNYYRLKAFDKDASSKISNVESVSFNNIASFNLSKLSPIPVRNKLAYTITNEKEEWLQIKIIDLTGKLIKEEQKHLLPGNTELTSEVEDLQKGIYFLQAINKNGNIVVQRFIK
jgi:PKD repeat protein